MHYDNDNDNYNANTQNKREIDRVHNYRLYIATLNIKHKTCDRIKTALRFLVSHNAMKRAKMTSKTITCMTSD